MTGVQTCALPISIVPEPVPIPAPEAAPESAAVIVEAAVLEPAPVIAEAAIVPEPVAITAPEAAAVTAEPAAAPPDALHNNLWAAAAMVSEAAFTHAVPPSPASPAALPLAVPPPEPAPLPVSQSVLTPEAGPVGAFLTNFRHAPDALQWAFFGGTAAFLGVILAAIWFAAK